VGIGDVLHIGHTRVEVFDDALMVAREQHLTIGAPSHGPDRVLMSRDQLLEFECIALRREGIRIRMPHWKKASTPPKD
jgi:hypothetical protein